MNLIIMAALLLQEATLEDSVANFAKGEPGARGEILGAGPCTIPLLRKIRDKAPARVDALIDDLKKAAAGFETRTLVGLLDEKSSIETGGGVPFLAAWDSLCNGLPILYDPTLTHTHFEKKVLLSAKGRPRRELLDSLCRQADLDYGFFYGILLVASPGRLWPAAPPPTRRSALTADEEEQAARLIDRLSSDEIEVRERAYAALRKLGLGVLPLLETGALERRGEEQARCRRIILELMAGPTPAHFHTPAAERQSLSGADEDLRKSLKEARVSFKTGGMALVPLLRLLLETRGVPLRLAPWIRGALVTLDLQDQSAWAVLSMVTHAYGFDFLVQDGKVVIDARQEIEARLPSNR